MRSTLNFTLSSILILVGCIFAQGIDPGTQNLTHSWTFNDGTANDYVGGANGTLVGGAEVWEGSLFTVYPDQWMEMPGNKIAINTYSEITLTTWFYSVEAANAEYTMLAFFGDTLNAVGVNYYFFCVARGDDKSRAAISCGVLTSSPYSGESGADGPELDDGELHHLASTLTDSAITLYVDGELTMITTPLKEKNTIAAISPALAYLSKSGYSGDATWMGEILEFNIYNRALSADEVLYLFNSGASTTDVGKQTANQPNECRLVQNYPNPFNPSTTISFSVPIKSYVSLKVYDSIGNEVATIVSDELSAGNYTRQWNPTNISSGVYFCRLQAGEFTACKKLVLVH